MANHAVDFGDVRLLAYVVWMSGCARTVPADKQKGVLCCVFFVLRLCLDVVLGEEGLGRGREGGTHALLMSTAMPSHVTFPVTGTPPAGTPVSPCVREVGQIIKVRGHMYNSRLPNL